jgi:hypothetical protein
VFPPPPSPELPPLHPASAMDVSIAYNHDNRLIIPSVPYSAIVAEREGTVL